MGGKGFGKILSYLLGEGIDAIKGGMDAKVEEVKNRTEIAVTHVAKKLALVLMALLGAIFIMVGISQYLSAIVGALANGLGYVLVGAVVLFIALIGRIFSSA